jgi:hypothetical protein
MRHQVEIREPVAAAPSLEIEAKLDELIEAYRAKKRYPGRLGVTSCRHSDRPHLIAARGAPGSTRSGALEGRR